MQTHPDPCATAVEPPDGLSGHSEGLWRTLVAGRELSPVQLELLRQALTSLDRADAAAHEIAHDGATVPTRFDGIKAHPAVGIEATHRALFAKLMAQVNIDGVVKQIGRPGAGSEPSSRARRLRVAG
jgi:hypothetical protein